MRQYQTIVVGTALDGRDTTTLRHAALFARAASSNAVHVAHVARTGEIPHAMIEQEPDLSGRVTDHVGQHLCRLVDEHRSLFPEGTEIHSSVLQGSTALELVRLTTNVSADLLCVGRRPPEERDLLSDAALQVIRKSPCSVFVVPPGSEDSYERILVPTDFSDHSKEALEVACAIARGMGNSSITVQHTYEVPLGWHKRGVSYEEFAATVRGHAQKDWERLVPSIDFQGVAHDVRFDLGTSVPETIVRVSNELDSQLVVVGSHGRTRPAGFLLGHVADTVCSSTRRAVLCVKRKGEVVSFLRALLQFFEFESPDSARE